jgi:amino acid transporter
MCVPSSISIEMREIAARGAPGALRRVVPLWLLVFYCLGVTIGAGIYVLVGATIARAGPYAPLAFLIAGVVMAFSAASFAELAGRMPVSAGEAIYVRHGFASRRAGRVTGVLVIVVAVIAAAAIAKGAAGYLSILVPLQRDVATALLIVAMGLVAIWGISEAMSVSAVMTMVEVAGLVAIVVAGLWLKPDAASMALAWPASNDAEAWRGVFGAAILGFFAFIGFESAVNLAEETHAPHAAIPRAIFITLVAVAVLYVGVTVVAAAFATRAELAVSPAPLSLVFQRTTGASPTLIAIIALLATTNGVIAQIVLGSRVLYGLARDGGAPDVFKNVHGRLRTPVEATVAVTAAALVFALAVPLERLADLTTRVMLVVFVLVNSALVLIKWRREPAPEGTFVVPLAVPIIGALTCVALLVADQLV